MKASLRFLLVVVLVGDFDLDEDALEELRRLGYSAVPDHQLRRDLWACDFVDLGVPSAATQVRNA